MATTRSIELGIDQPAARRRFGAPLLAAWVAGFSILYFLAAKLGIATSLPPQGIVTIWPPNAIILVVLLAVDRRHWWAFFAATVVTEVIADVPAYPLWAAASYGFVNFLEAATAAFLLQRFCRGVPPLTGVNGFVNFIFIGPLLASGTAAMLGAAVYKMGAPELDYIHYWRVFWFGDALGLLVVGTCLLSLFRVPLWWSEARLSKALEGLVLMAALGAAIGAAFFTGPDIARLYILFPFLLWAAVRFGVHGAGVAVLSVIGAAIGSAVMGLGPFSALSALDNVVALQSLSVIVALSTFFLAFTIEDFWRANARLQTEVGEHARTASALKLAKQALERRNSELDEIVAERTEDLRDTVAQNQVLLREMYHRVKNSLQMISGMIAMQGRTGTTRDLSWKVTKQIGAISSTYDVMHRMGSVEAADLFPIVSELCGRISETAGGAVSLSCETQGEAVVPASVAVSLALALNELVTNSIKHGAHAREPVIQVSTRRDGPKAVITITDNGPGFPPGFEIKDAKGFGLRMARRVVAHAGGEIVLAGTSEGSKVEVWLPVTSESRDR